MGEKSAGSCRCKGLLIHSCQHYVIYLLVGFCLGDTLVVLKANISGDAVQLRVSKDLVPFDVVKAYR